MRKHETARKAARHGFTAVEMLVVLSLAAVVLGSVVVAFGTIVRSQPGIASVVTVPLGSDRLTNFYGSASIEPENTPTAPHYGMMALAEELREQFNTDILSATAVFCLPRTSTNTYRPSTISYNPSEHGELDTPQKFRAHLSTIGITPLPYLDYRNPGLTAPAENASIFILGYSKVVNQLKVLALYDIDVIRFTDPTPQKLNGFHASVKRYTDDTRGSTYPLAFAGGYSVFYPPSKPDFTKAADWATDGFTPLFITFERSTRIAWTEGTPTDRFKKAAERSFYFVWWPDPGARHLGPISNNSIDASDMRQAYNHMGGRTSFMFTVPMFPAL